MKRLLWRFHGLKMNGVAPTARISPLNVRRSKGCFLWVGKESTVHAKLFYERPGAVIKIGARTFIGKSTIIAATGVVIDDDVLISWGVTIIDHDSHPLDFNLRANDVLAWRDGRKDWTHIPAEKVVIRSKAWIGFGATILKGVSIGEGAVVAAQSVVTKNVDAYSLVAGNPARFIRHLQASPTLRCV